MKIERKIKTTGASYKVTRELLNEDKRQRFIVGDIDSILIEGTINVLNFRTRGMGWFFGRGLTNERVPWPILENGGADFHHCWFVDSM